ncbi:hypothetical protein VMCG_04300 [Cytospora schulzeri]|uniref:RING-type domain-containing protein n=1 Tax=Cytospora schulzeri TaxID=448051 RepID=A0A423WSJ2_9PEZI|nr:hypothetical protein VMCG_04300 [Valsa malicola]
MGRRHAYALALVLANVRIVMCGLAETYTMMEVYSWQKESEMQLSILASNGVIVPLTYTVIPLTTNLGLNESQVSRGKISIEGKLVVADENNFDSIVGSDIIPYLCCDQLNDSFIQPNMILNTLMSNDPQPAAILLYSQLGMSCGLAGQGLVYNALLTMSDAEEASQALSITNSSGGNLGATISGNLTATPTPSKSGQQGGSNPAVAMSILYSITGLITVLFLIIIATGAIRARRYPERYGPRNGSGGRPAQSRARGLARAVLETIPIVKFGGSEPPKLDPNIELENANPPNTTDESGETPNNASGRQDSTIPESLPGAPTHPTSTGALGTASEGEANVKETGSSAIAGVQGDAPDEGALGCSICTDDFTVGEDVRVLPCHHQFHPQCIDPWLVNVSGTCPLCRLDLRPEEGEGEEGNTEMPEAPQPGAGIEGGNSSHASRRRSRLLELRGLRHATVEERIEALRRYQTEQQQGLPGNNEDEGHTRARLTDRLRDRFHIRTRAARQSPSGQEGDSSSVPTTSAN